MRRLMIIVGMLFLSMILTSCFRAAEEEPVNLTAESDSEEKVRARVELIRASLDEFEALTEEVEILGEEAIEAEQRASNATALLDLSEEELKALEDRLNPDNTKREIILVIFGAVLGVVLEEGWRWLIRTRRNTSEAFD